MDPNTVVIVTGLLAVLVVYAAVQDSPGGWEGTVGPATWNVGESWISTTAAVVALAFLVLFSGGSGGPIGMALMFGLLLMFGPMIYRAFGVGGAVSKTVFFGAATVMTWASTGLMVTGAQIISDIVREFAIVPRLAINSFAITAVLAAIVGTSRVLTTATSGKGSDAWTMP